VLTAMLFIAASVTLPGQGADSFPSINEGELSSGAITGVRQYSDESLYGYIDGGAELYMEYGFDTLSVTDIDIANGAIKLEIYKMSDAAAAFGIFSVLRFKCIAGVEFTKYLCRSDYQIQFCKGPYYVSVVNSNATVDEKSISEEIALTVASKIDAPDITFDNFFSGGVADDAMQSAKLVRGRLGLFSGAYGLYETLEECSGYSALIINLNGTILISILFDSMESLNLFADKEKLDLSLMAGGEKQITASGNTAIMTGEFDMLLQMK